MKTITSRIRWAGHMARIGEMNALNLWPFINVCRIQLGEQGNTILKWNFQTVLSEFIWIRIGAVSGPL
jgi:hypothetical protein